MRRPLTTSPCGPRRAAAASRLRRERVESSARLPAPSARISRRSSWTSGSMSPSTDPRGACRDDDVLLDEIVFVVEQFFVVIAGGGRRCGGLLGGPGRLLGHNGVELAPATGPTNLLANFTSDTFPTHATGEGPAARAGVNRLYRRVPTRLATRSGPVSPVATSLPRRTIITGFLKWACREEDRRPGPQGAFAAAADRPGPLPSRRPRRRRGQRRRGVTRATSLPARRAGLARAPPQVRPARILTPARDARPTAAASALASASAPGEAPSPCASSSRNR